MPSARLLVAAPLLSVVLAIAGFGWERARFGGTIADTTRKLEHEVRALVDDRVAAVSGVAAAVAAEQPLIAEAEAAPERLPELFDRLVALASAAAGPGQVAATVYVADSAVGYRVLAWSDGPGEQNLSPDRLSGPSAVFVAPGHAGMRLLAVRPVESGGRRIAVAVAETVLAASAPGGPAPRQLPTSFGPVSVIEQYASARDELTEGHGFIITAGNGTPLLEIRFTPEDLDRARQRFRRSVLAIAALPIPIVVGLTVPAVLARRRRRHGIGVWLGWTLAGAGLVLASVGLLLLVARGLELSDGVDSALLAAAALALVVLGPGALWWRVRKRAPPSTAPGRFALEQLAGGLVLAAAVEVTARLLVRRITAPALDRWEFVLFPFDPEGLLFLGTLLLTELALVLTAALLLAAIAARWQLPLWRPATWLAMALWIAPSVLLLAWDAGEARGVASGAAVLTGSVVAFALVAGPLRRYYRHTSQSMRLALGFLALFAPLVSVYPMAAVTAARTTQSLIEHAYAPATARHPQELREELERTRRDIDRLTILPELVSGRPSGNPQSATDRPESGPAYLVWSQTSLSRLRAVQDVELYGPDRALVSRFAINLPEYLYQTSFQTWQGSSCTWDVFGEVTPFGAETRLMLHAERGICDSNGRLLGGIVVHVASHDYSALPFVSSANPYHEALGITRATPPPARLRDLNVVVYGWSFQPIFVSGQVGWPVPREVFERLYDDGTPFWVPLEADGRTYHVHFSQNRAGIYALGYPAPTPFEHAMRFAEIAVLTAGFFILIQVGLLAAAPFVRRARAPLRLLFREIRTSFYRKLFLLFVAAAIAPVLVFALAFDSYMTARFRADVEFESRNIVTVARRVFEELIAADPRTASPANTPSDDVMVWIRQVISQDVNLFLGSELLATSQPDLFDSGLLPTRTPATVYRGIALQRLPMLVAEDRLGDFEYLVAAAPVRSLGRDGILTVPLASRQREIEREIDDLNRGVLVGGVLVVLFAAAIGASMASRVADPVARLTRATRQIAAGELNLRLEANTSDELGRLVDDFNSMAETLVRQRAELARTNQLEAWNEMARQVAHEIKNPLTPIQLAAEHLQHVHDDRGRPLGAIVDRCLQTVLTQVRLLRQIASEFSNFAGRPIPRPEAVDPSALVASVIDPYRVNIAERIRFEVDVPAELPHVLVDRTLVARALTNLVENAVQAMPGGGLLRVTARVEGDRLAIRLTDTGPGMDATALARAFEPYFSTKTGGSGLGLANARRNIETSGGTVEIDSAPGAGATLTVRLPLAASPPGAPEAASSRTR